MQLIEEGLIQEGGRKNWDDTSDTQVLRIVGAGYSETESKHKANELELWLPCVFSKTQYRGLLWRTVKTEET